jgi:hypothetical protein
MVNCIVQRKEYLPEPPSWPSREGSLLTSVKGFEMIRRKGYRNLTDIKTPRILSRKEVRVLYETCAQS